MPVVTGYFRGQSSLTESVPANLPGSVTPIALNDAWTTNCATSGPNADQINVPYANTLKFAGAPQVLDLTNLTDLYGNVITFSYLRWIAIKHNGKVDTQVLLMGYATSTVNAHTGFVSNPGQLSIYPSSPNNDGWFFLSAPNQSGVPVSPGNKLLNFDPGSATFTANILIAGCFSPPPPSSRPLILTAQSPVGRRIVRRNFINGRIN